MAVRCRVRRFPGRFRDHGRKSFPAGTGGGGDGEGLGDGAAVLEDGTEVPVEEELATALAGTAEQFAGLAAWAADEARFCDLGEREEVIGTGGRELQRRLLEATFAIDAAREERAGQVTSAAGIPHGSVEAGHERGVTSVSGPVRVSRMAYRNRREPNLYPADARGSSPMIPIPWGCGPGGVSPGRRGVRAGPRGHQGTHRGHGRPAQLTGLAEDLAAWTDDFYEQRARDADDDLPDTDVIMMQATARASPCARRPQERGQGRYSASGDQEDGRDRRGRRLHPRRPGTGGHRRPPGPPQGPSRPEGPGQVGIRLDHRIHRGHDRRGL